MVLKVPAYEFSTMDRTTGTATPKNTGSLKCFEVVKDIAQMFEG